MQLEGFITYIRAERRYSRHTILNYERDIRQFIDYLSEHSSTDVEDLDPSMVTAEDVREWIMSLSEEGLNARSINRMISSMRAYYRWLRRSGVVENDPLAHIKNQKISSHLPDYVPESQMQKIIQELDQFSREGDLENKRDALILFVFYSTGIRLAELADIRLSDFSNDFSELRVRGKGNKDRIVPIVDFTRTKIKEYLATLKEQNTCIWPPNFLFLTKEGEGLTHIAIYGIVKEILTKAGVQGKRSPHVMRHTFATHMMNDGADIREIQELLGHSSLSSTQTYTHNSIAELKKVYAKAHPRAKKDE